MITINKEMAVFEVKRAKVPVYRFAGVGAPMGPCLFKGDSVRVVQKRWEWVYVVYQDKGGEPIRGWLDSHALIHLN